MKWKKLTEFPEQKVTKRSYGSSITYWKVENGKVWHQWKKLMKADIETFEVYEDNDFIARDKDFVYHGWTKLAKVDRDSFQEVGDSYWKDKNHAYMEYETSLKPLKGLDAASFNYLGNGYAFDQNFAYYYGKVIKSCTQPTTLELIPKHKTFAKDAEHVFYESAALKGADLKSWKPLKNGFSKDEKRVYFDARKLPKVDIETWEHLHRAYSKDKNRVYCMNYIEYDKSPAEWDKKKVVEFYKSGK